MSKYNSLRQKNCHGPSEIRRWFQVTLRLEPDPMNTFGQSHRRLEPYSCGPPTKHVIISAQYLGPLSGVRRPQPFLV